MAVRLLCLSSASSPHSMPETPPPPTTLLHNLRLVPVNVTVSCRTIRS